MAMQQETETIYIPLLIRTRSGLLSCCRVQLGAYTAALQRCSVATLPAYSLPAQVHPVLHAAAAALQCYTYQNCAKTIVADIQREKGSSEKLCPLKYHDAVTLFRYVEFQKVYVFNWST